MLGLKIDQGFIIQLIIIVYHSQFAPLGFCGKLVTSLVAQMVKCVPTLQETRFDSWVRKILWRRKWQPTPVLLLGKSHGWRSMVGYSPWDRKESDMTERLHFHFCVYCKCKFVTVKFSKMTHCKISHF